MNLFSTKGRMPRTEYLFHNVITTLVLFLILILVGVLANEESILSTIVGMPLFGLAVLMYIVVDIISTIKRLHDLNRNGWGFWLFLVPIYNIFFGLGLTFQRGTRGDNNYGSDPRKDEDRNIKKMVLRNLIIIALLVLSIVNVLDARNNRDVAVVEDFIVSPQEHSYLIIATDDDPEYPYSLAKVSNITSDAMLLYFSNYQYGTSYGAENAIPTNQKEFQENFYFAGMYSISYLDSLKIKKVIFQE